MIFISGTHHKKQNCDTFDLIYQYKFFYKKYSNKFFPKKMRFNSFQGFNILKIKKNGGWGDIRDHELCNSFINSSYNY